MTGWMQSIRRKSAADAVANAANCWRTSAQQPLDVEWLIEPKNRRAPSHCDWTVSTRDCDVTLLDWPACQQSNCLGLNSDLIHHEILC